MWSYFFSYWPSYLVKKKQKSSWSWSFLLMVFSNSLMTSKIVDWKDCFSSRNHQQVASCVASTVPPTVKPLDCCSRVTGIVSPFTASNSFVTVNTRAQTLLYCGRVLISLSRVCCPASSHQNVTATSCVSSNMTLTSCSKEKNVYVPAGGSRMSPLFCSYYQCCLLVFLHCHDK